jgi:TolB protein
MLAWVFRRSEGFRRPARADWRHGRCQVAFSDLVAFPPSSTLLLLLTLLLLVPLLLTSWLPLAPAAMGEVTPKRPEPRRLTTDGTYKYHLQWSPDGQTLLFTRIAQGQMALWVIPAAGGEMKRLLPGHKEPHFDGHFSPDGQRIVYVYDRLQGTDGKLQINICNCDGSQDKVFIPHQAFEESPRFHPSGRSVLWVSTRQKNPDLFLVDQDGKNEKRLTNHPALDLHPAWSPDGRQIAFSSNRHGTQKIYLMDADGSNVRRLTDGEGLDSWPAWRPDGRWLAFVSHRSGNYDIWAIQPDGQGLRNLTQHPAHDTCPAWSPDGRQLAFISTRHGGSDIYIMSLEGLLPPPSDKTR